VAAVANGREAVELGGREHFDVLLTDVFMPDLGGLDVIRAFRRISPETKVIAMTAQGSLEIAMEAISEGAVDFIAKPFDIEQVMSVVERAAEQAQVPPEEDEAHLSGSGLIGHSPQMVRVYKLTAYAARTDTTVLIEGESGTGKGVFSRLIHNRSPRARGPFVDLNCAGLSKELLESELFGHERGAFTNAVNTKPGLFEVAADGTLFLDEIGEMDVTVQARLLKAIEEKRFRRVGGIRDLTANFRLVAATNRDLAAEAAAGRFRSDLYYRLNVVRVRMPPLRERPEDIPVLVEVMLRPLAKEIGKPLPAISPRALKKLEQYPWPGNVRELRNVLERAMLTMSGKEIRSEGLLLETQSAAVPTSSSGLPTAEWEIRPLDDVVADYVRAAVDAAGGNVRKAARQLQISPSTLYARLKEKVQ
jgi:DNA-binding NtrC family response regulator